MASIQEYLDLIKNAIYGKDVRQAIHDGIQQCYYDGKAGSTDLEARQRLDTDEANITSLTSRMSAAENDINVLDARIDSGISSNIGENYCVLPSGLKICWGQGTARSVSFPVVYNSAPQVVMTPTKSAKANGYLIAAELVGVTATGFSYKVKYTHTTYADDGGEASEPCSWIAVGY